MLVVCERWWWQRPFPYRHTIEGAFPLSPRKKRHRNQFRVVISMSQSTEQDITTNEADADLLTEKAESSGFPRLPPKCPSAKTGEFRVVNMPVYVKGRGPGKYNGGVEWKRATEGYRAKVNRTSAGEIHLCDGSTFVGYSCFTTPDTQIVFKKGTMYGPDGEPVYTGEFDAKQCGYSSPYWAAKGMYESECGILWNGGVAFKGRFKDGKRQGVFSVYPTKYPSSWFKAEFKDDVMINRDDGEPLPSLDTAVREKDETPGPEGDIATTEPSAEAPSHTDTVAIPVAVSTDKPTPRVLHVESTVSTPQVDLVDDVSERTSKRQKLTASIGAEVDGTELDAATATSVAGATHRATSSIPNDNPERQLVRSVAEGWEAAGIECVGKEQVDEITMKMSDGSKRRLDMQIRKGGCVGIVEFKADAKDFMHGVGQLSGYERRMREAVDERGEKGAYAKAVMNGNASALVVTPTMPDEYDIETAAGMRPRVDSWWPGCGREPL